MTPEDREFIIRVLAAHAKVMKLSSSFTAEQYREYIADFANVAPEPKAPQPKTVRTADGKEFTVRSRAS